MTKLILALAVTLLVLPASTQATEYLNIDARLQTPDGVIYDGTIYVTSDGCTVVDDTNTEHVVEGPQAICAVQFFEDIGIIDATFGYYDGIGLYLRSVQDNGDNNYVNDSVNYAEFWSYFVNYVSPSVGMDAYELVDGDTVVIAFGPYVESALRLRTADSEVLAGEKIVARVQTAADAQGTQFTPVAGATVTFNDTTVTTNALGKATYEPAADETSVEIAATATGSLTSATKTITVVERNKRAKILTDEQLMAMADLGVGKLKSEINGEDGLILGSQSMSEWAAMALAADGTSAGRLTQAVLAYEPTAADGANEISRHILALVALGYDPAATNGIDFVARLKKTKSGKQFGSSEFVNDDIFAGLALIAAGEPINSKDVRIALRAAKKGLNSDGGVAFAVDSTTSDVDTTAFYYQLIVAADNAGSTVPQIAARKSTFAFLKSQQNLDGGFGYSDDEVSNASTTAVVTQAFNSVALDPVTVSSNLRDSYDYLKSVQKDNGQFAYNDYMASNFDVLNTAYAVIALNSKSLPVLPATQE